MKKLTQFPAEEKIHNVRMYQEYKELGMVDGWLPGNKLQNYNLMLKLPDLAQRPIKNSTCLDVGCGTGDFSKFLRKRHIKDYLGVDIYDLALEKAQEKYPDETFLHLDILSQELPNTFDFAFSSGALTVKMKTIKNPDFLYSMVKRMWELTTVGVVFNVLSDTDYAPDPDLFFYNREEVETICRKIIGKKDHLFSEFTPGVAQFHIYLWRM